MRSSGVKVQMSPSCLLCLLLELSCWTIAISHAQITAETDGATPTIAPSSYLCHRDDTRRELNVDTCRTVPGASCYTQIRRTTDNTFYVKRGCLYNCAAEYRNRTIRECCTTSLCNTHLLTQENFTSITRPLKESPPTFTTLTTVATTSEVSTAAPSRTIIPPRIVPDRITQPQDHITPPPEEPPAVLLKCNCDQCGGETECVGVTCVTRFNVDRTGDGSQYRSFCMNVSAVICREDRSQICCDTDYCNRIVGRSTTPTNIADTSTVTDISSSDMTSGATPTHKASVRKSTDSYFIIAMVIALVGGFIVAILIIVIMVRVIVNHRRRSQHNIPRLTPPTKANTCEESNEDLISKLKSSPVMAPSIREKRSLTSSLSLISIDSNYHSGFSSHSTLSDSSKLAADNPLKYLGTSV